MNCPFCYKAMVALDQTTWLPPDYAGHKTVFHECFSVGCFGYKMNQTFRYTTPSYRCVTDYFKKNITEEYKMADCVIKVDNFNSKIMTINRDTTYLRGNTLIAKIPRSLWLNKTNMEETLNTIKWIITFS